MSPFDYAPVGTPLLGGPPPWTHLAITRSLVRLGAVLVLPNLTAKVMLHVRRSLQSLPIRVRRPRSPRATASPASRSRSPEVS